MKIDEFEDKLTGVDALEDRIEKRQLEEGDWRILKIVVKIWRNLRYAKIPNTPFICGEAGKKGTDNMPEYYFICPTYGLEGFASYKKDKDYSAPGW